MIINNLRGKSFKVISRLPLGEGELAVVARQTRVGALVDACLLWQGSGTELPLPLFGGSFGCFAPVRDLYEEISKELKGAEDHAPAAIIAAVRSSAYIGYPMYAGGKEAEARGRFLEALRRYVAEAKAHPYRTPR